MKSTGSSWLGPRHHARGARRPPHLIRRATFDLTGLPPTPEEVEAFLADDSPEAFAKVVDRLLASPAYGERWARHWLDVVRYADYHDGNPKTRDGQLRADAKPGAIATGSSIRSTATCRSTSSSCIRSPAICCRRRTAGELYPDGLIATTFLVQRGRGTAATPTRRRWSATWSTTRSTRSARRSWA